jgi:hypothetical protein
VFLQENSYHSAGHHKSVCCHIDYGVGNG